MKATFGKSTLEAYFSWKHWTIRLWNQKKKKHFASHAARMFSKSAFLTGCLASFLEFSKCIERFGNLDCSINNITKIPKYNAWIKIQWTHRGHPNSQGLWSTACLVLQKGLSADRRDHVFYIQCLSLEDTLSVAKYQILQTYFSKIFFRVIPSWPNIYSNLKMS